MEGPSMTWIKNRVLSLRERIQSMDRDLTVYSNPAIRTSVPFPYIGKLPIRRFKIVDGSFEFMGREKLQEIYKAISTVSETEYAEYFINGNLGWGKSHILAVIVCILSWHHKVIYIPHVKHMLKENFTYLQNSFYLAYAEDDEKLEIIRNAKSWEDLRNFSLSEFYRGVKLIFIQDQVNAFDLEKDNVDSVDNSVKIHVKSLLAKISANHISIEGSPANIQNLQRMRLRNSDDKNFYIFGGLEPNEMQFWWKHNENEGLLPDILLDRNPKNDSSSQDTDAGTVILRRKEVEGLTGNNMLLLRAILATKGSQKCSDFPSFISQVVKHDEFATVKQQISEFHLQIMNNGNPREVEHYINIMHSCLTGDTVSAYTPGLTDQEFFKILQNGSAVSSSGYARHVMSSLLRTTENDAFCSERYYEALVLFKKNPSVRGFVAEMITLSTIARKGILVGERMYFPSEVRVVSDIRLDLTLGTCLYIPDKFNYAAIDCLILHLQPPVNSGDSIMPRTAYLVPIQITIAERHSASEDHFFESWDPMRERLVSNNYFVEVNFVWITKKPFHHREMTGHPGKRLRSGAWKPEYPPYRSINLSFSDINERLGQILNTDG